MTLRELRESQNLTQVELAVAVDVSPATIYRIEAGKSDPSAETRAALEDFFGTEIK